MFIDTGPIEWYFDQYFQQLWVYFQFMFGVKYLSAVVSLAAEVLIIPFSIH